MGGDAALADEARLTVYDAAYLAPARRRKLPLATLVRQMCAAAMTLGVRPSRHRLIPAPPPVQTRPEPRNHVLAPYQLVKDLRTGTETSNPGTVLEGDLDAFMAAALADARAGATRPEASARAR